jgi:hypothetical protein
MSDDGETNHQNPEDRGACAVHARSIKAKLITPTTDNIQHHVSTNPSWIMAHQSSTMEIELNFRLDTDGRTASTSETNNDEKRKTDEDQKMVDYSSKAVMTNLDSLSTSTLDDVLLDCEISDSGLMPRTFWVPVEGMEPRCSLEQFALDVFRHHVPPSLDFDKKTSGVEW